MGLLGVILPILSKNFDILGKKNPKTHPKSSPKPPSNDLKPSQTSQKSQNLSGPPQKSPNFSNFADFTFRAELLVLVRHHVPTQGELVHLGFLPPQIENSDFWVWGRHPEGSGRDFLGGIWGFLGWGLTGDPAAEARFGVGFVLAVAVTEGGKTGLRV